MHSFSQVIVKSGDRSFLICYHVLDLYTQGSCWASALSLWAVFKTSQLKQKSLEERYWFRMWTIPHGLTCLNICYPTGILLWGVVRPLRSGSSLEEVDHWDSIVGYTPAVPSAFSLLMGCNQPHHVCHHKYKPLPPSWLPLSMMDCILSNCEPKQKFPPLQCFFLVWFSIIAAIKVTDSSTEGSWNFI